MNDDDGATNDDGQAAPLGVKRQLTPEGGSPSSRARVEPARGEMRPGEDPPIVPAAKARASSSSTGVHA
eukprot:10992772-Alexandrium_andersonii.AAC.1